MHYYTQFVLVIKWQSRFTCKMARQTGWRDYVGGVKEWLTPTPPSGKSFRLKSSMKKQTSRGGY